MYRKYRIPSNKKKKKIYGNDIRVKLLGSVADLFQEFIL